MLDHRAGNTGKIRATLLNRTPPNPKALGQLRAQDRLIENTGGLGVPVQQPAVKGGPATVRATRQVSDHDVGVQQRIARPRRAVTKGGGDEAVAGDLLVSAVAATGPTRLTLQITQRLGDRAIVTGLRLGGDRRVGGAPQDAHALRGPKREVEPRDRAVADRPAQLASIDRVAGLQQPRQAVVVDLAVDPEGDAGAAGPLPGCFALTGVVVLAAMGDLFEVVALRLIAGRELPHREHAPMSRERPKHPRCTSVLRCCCWPRYRSSRCEEERPTVGVRYVGSSRACVADRNGKRLAVRYGSSAGLLPSGDRFQAMGIGCSRRPRADRWRSV